MTPLSTIAAVATGPAPGGVGILRVSGPEALSVARVVAPGLPEKPEPRHAYVVRLGDGRGGLLDEGLALHFPAPRSYTGEDVVELHAHGSPRLLSLLLSGLLSTGRARLAEPGEFTRRAFMNGRLDLQRAEAVADLVAAESEAAVRAAAAQVTGALAGRLAPCLEGLRALHADLEAVLSFPDESEGVEEGLLSRVGEEAARVEALSAEAARGRVVRRGARVVLVGPPNAGKSTLFNRLLGEERALVDDAPGTTRDALEARLELDGLAVTLVDTAGLREAPGRLEALGVERARKELAAADLVLLLLPPGEDPAPWRAELPAGTPRLELRGKADMGSLDAAVPRPPGPVPGQGAREAEGAAWAPGAADDAAKRPGARGDARGAETLDVAASAGRVVEAAVARASGEVSSHGSLALGRALGPRGPGAGGPLGGDEVSSVAAFAAGSDEAASDGLLETGRSLDPRGVSAGPWNVVARAGSAMDAASGPTSDGGSGGAPARRPWIAPRGVHAVRYPGGAEPVLQPVGDVSGMSGTLGVSGLTGEGVDAVRDAVRRNLLGDGTSGAVAFATERHAECLRRAAECMARAARAVDVSTLEVVAGEVALGFHALLDITGEDATEALLDDVFRRFCIGK